MAVDAVAICVNELVVGLIAEYGSGLICGRYGVRERCENRLSVDRLFRTFIDPYCNVSVDMLLYCMGIRHATRGWIVSESETPV